MDAMGTLLQDLRYGLRMLRDRAALSFVAILTLGLGIGANTTIFNWIQTLLLRPLPGVERQEDLVVFLGKTAGGVLGTVSYPDYVDFRDRAQSLSGLVLYDLNPMGLEIAGQSERLWGSIVTGNYFDVLGVKAELGRTFLPSDDRTPGEAPVVVLSHAFWRRRFGGDPQVVGRTVKLNGHDFLVVGVAAEGFGGTFSGLNLDAWVPIMMQPTLQGYDLLTQRGNHSMEALARLRPGVGREAARAELNAIAERLAKEYPATNEGRGVVIEPLWNAPWGAQKVLRPVLAVFMGMVCLVLLIACANVANLLLARATSRQREIAVRLAVGASRWRLVRQLLTESLLLAALGGVAGLLLALWSGNALTLFVPPSDFPVNVTVPFGGREVAFAFAVTLLTGVLFGLAPALQTTRPDLVSGLKDEVSPSGHGRRRLRSALVIGQIALSLLTLVCAGLFVRSLHNAQNIDPGFQPKHLLLASVDLSARGFDEPHALQFYQQLQERVEALPGVRSASFGRLVPLDWGGNSDTSATIEGYEPKPGEEILLPLNVVGPQYFETMGIAMASGRDFTAQDAKRSEEEPIVVNEALVQRYWPGPADAIGRRIHIGKTTCTVVGVARNAKIRSLGEEPFPYLYLLIQHNFRSRMTLYVRTQGDPLEVAAAVREQLRALDPGVPLYGIRPMEQHMGISVFTQKLSGTLLTLFGLLAMGLAAIGVYGVMAYAVSQRTREIGIRMALGARKRDVLGMVLRQGLRLTLLGVALGLTAALVTTPFLRSQLLEVSPTDPAIFTGVTLLLAGVALVACAVPARRAAAVDPMRALRHE
jgi:putative ABC transport system permease protein